MTDTEGSPQPTRRSLLRSLGAMPLAVVPLPRPRPIRPSAAPVRIYMLRGLFVGGYIFSRGLDALAPKIESRVPGARATVHWNEEVLTLIGDASAAYRHNGARLVFVGHSAGADTSLYISLAISPIPVPLIVTIDPTRIAPTIPDNVGHLINIYNRTTVLGGGAFGTQRYGSRLEQIDVSERGVLHIGMDKLPFVQDTIMERVAQLATR